MKSLMLDESVVPDRWLTIAQACDEANVSRRTINNWMANGKLELVRTAGGCPRIKASSLWRNYNVRNQER